MLGDYGAEVIKVEPPAGDTLRAWKTSGVSIHWKVYARNKKSLCLDLRKPESARYAFAIFTVELHFRGKLPARNARSHGAFT